MIKTVAPIAIFIAVVSFAWLGTVSVSAQPVASNQCSCDYCETVPPWINCYEPAVQASGSCGLYLWAFCYPDVFEPLSFFPNAELLGPRATDAASVSDATRPARVSDAS